MNCTECDRPVLVKSLGLCAWHYERYRCRNDLGKLHVTVCLGDCGTRVHNARYITIPGIVQGHGHNKAWCSGCYRKYQPSAPEKDPYRGPCAVCGEPMMVGDLEPGYVQFWGLGMCKTDYYRKGKPLKSRFGEGNTRSKLTEQMVREIRARCDAKESSYVISLDYPIEAASVRRIGRRESWKHLVD